MHRWIASAAGGTSQRLKPGSAMVRGAIEPARRAAWRRPRRLSPLIDAPPCLRRRIIDPVSCFTLAIACLRFLPLQQRRRAAAAAGGSSRRGPSRPRRRILADHLRRPELVRCGRDALGRRRPRGWLRRNRRSGWPCAPVWLDLAPTLMTRPLPRCRPRSPVKTSAPSARAMAIELSASACAPSPARARSAPKSPTSVARAEGRRL